MIIVVDTETTHYKPELAHVIEIGAIGIDPDGKVHKFEEVVNPEIDLRGCEKALSISGISPEEILSSRKTLEVAGDFRSWLDQLREEFDLKLAGYNSDNYDSMILRRYPWRIQREDWIFDVMKMCMDPMGKAGVLPFQYGKYKWPKLTEAEEFYGIIRDGDAHRALSDARTTMEILFKLIPGAV